MYTPRALFPDTHVKRPVRTSRKHISVPREAPEEVSSPRAVKPRAQLEEDRLVSDAINQLQAELKQNR